MLGRVLLLRVGPAVGAFTASAVAFAAAVPSGTQAPAELPDLDQEVPAQLEITAAGDAERRVYRLGQ